ncbi:hypothetical protein A3F07_02425 [candidate division WWE3 bacterium RIFCSPHIGHO2_12_FULL_38_15]|uniref:Uncharacterized protein n=1 Tax=candidate division WWE3 bacterium RIFCSPHIGHO2_02_FULL_38_14 TaxID=1802620 RepID=A0A1F4V674_UNCKA|nr:MAG: hypothetical protein A2793_02600 [candidate division WWE3 bacterium RIFCSPHIGHO2_01_FULL_38_45]OGC48768.1 MAG: hypothetical protein A3F07_02425 [candidate division WWE3 bacterium RIFCSPHIGHO2_12_FULL_38_15]OGC52631.1 MAG: hypothetical protein A3B64_03850 [candidate division WWE3 bacterium RIFCSPLOWO2_01_FULL_37_24]OGC52688.1 MAG: hypothetical protein A3D91_03385 [candidate division WWE3 bacterium RIFCSPHIGHO2_02_FULL_38_14]
MKRRLFIAITGLLIAIVLAGCQESTGSPEPQAASQPQQKSQACSPSEGESGWSQIVVEVSVPVYQNGVYAGNDVLSPANNGTFELIWQNTEGRREGRGYVNAPPAGEKRTFQLPSGSSFEIFSCGTTFFGRQAPSNVVSG